MDIEFLLELYFEGLTSAEEEAKLRRFFTTNDVPDHLKQYKPLFLHFEYEIKQIVAKRKNRPTSIIRWISGIAASIALLLGSFYLTSQHKRCPNTGDYVIINGRCYTDAATIRSATVRTLHEIAEGDGDFSPEAKTPDGLNIVENQLKEFDFLLEK